MSSAMFMSTVKLGDSKNSGLGTAVAQTMTAAEQTSELKFKPRNLISFWSVSWPISRKS